MPIGYEHVSCFVFLLLLEPSSLTKQLRFDLIDLGSAVLIKMEMDSRSRENEGLCKMNLHQIFLLSLLLLKLEHIYQIVPRDIS